MYFVFRLVLLIEQPSIKNLVFERGVLSQWLCDLVHERMQDLHDATNGDNQAFIKGLLDQHKASIAQSQLEQQKIQEQIKTLEKDVKDSLEREQQERDLQKTNRC